MVIFNIHVWSSIGLTGSTMRFASGSGQVHQASASFRGKKVTLRPFFSKATWDRTKIWRTWICDQMAMLSLTLFPNTSKKSKKNCWVCGVLKISPFLPEDIHRFSWNILSPPDFQTKSPWKQLQLLQRCPRHHRRPKDPEIPKSVDFKALQKM